MSIGEKLLTLQQSDFENCVKYYETLKLDERVFAGENMVLAKTAHKIAFTMTMWFQKLIDGPEWSRPYLQLLQSDSVQLIPSVVLGNKRTLHLYERACIEDFLRYFYYFDHKIEHLLMQAYPTRFETIESLISWVREYPYLSEHKETVSVSCNGLTSGYKELSRTVHGRAIEGIQPENSLKQLHQPFSQPTKERDLLRLIFCNIFFLLSLFHVEEYRALNLDEKRLLAQHLIPEHKRVLAGLL